MSELEAFAFYKGIEDGKLDKYDDGSDAATAVLTLGICGGPTVDKEAYDRGWRIGKELRDAES